MRQRKRTSDSKVGKTDTGQKTSLNRINDEVKAKRDMSIKVKGLKMPERRGERMLDEIRRERERGRKEDGGGRVMQTRCSQAHTSSLCTDLLSVWILFRSNTGPLAKRFCLIFSLYAIYDIARALKWFQPPSHRGVHYFENTHLCPYARCLAESPDE